MAKTRKAGKNKRAPPQVLAYDLGGTKVAVGIVDAHGKILTSHREPALIAQGQAATMKQLVRLGQAMIERFPKARAVGIASAGPLDPIRGELLDPTNFTGPDGNWGRVPLKKILEKGLKLRVQVENDAAAAILAERWKGQAKKHESAMVLTLGTGLGTGIVANGALVRAGRNQHTEAGHLILNAGDSTAPCGCGNLGCAEAYLSGRNFTHRARIRLENAQIDAPQIAARAREGDSKALQLFEEYAFWLATALHNYAVTFGPEIVILAGSFSAASDLFLEKTEKRLSELLQRRNEVFAIQPKLAVSRLENQSGLLGGAFTALTRLTRG